MIAPLVALAVAGLVAFAVSRLDLHMVGHDLVTASPGWIALALLLMALSLVLRSISWQQVLRAALPDTRVRWPPVIRATMIGVMGSAVFPGRVGEPTRVIVLARRLQGPTRQLLAVIAGTVFSQTLINLLALAILAAITFSSVSIFQGHEAGVLGALAVPALLVLLVLTGPPLLRLASHSRVPRLRRAAQGVRRILALARTGLTVFTRPRHGIPAVGAQLLAWALQWGSCYMVVLALGLQDKATPATAAAILLAVNVSAVLPATPSNVGVFQAACLVVLAAYGVGAGQALAYGIILQAVELVTALALGAPALLAEGLTWRDIRSAPGEATEVIPAVDPAGRGGE
ncbi:MAG TPA: lysylphosphatidylglycerol synthase transmembrane domain-containing protein [Solirubrobacteraceae bacterium]|jgi:phosphatidylinositol alpha-mannosyltransferase|nr:lysylphosphatidylglycerol synthase transmembrane domain-containing protein [Solirubrobacteraceae bacterium]